MACSAGCPLHGRCGGVSLQREIRGREILKSYDPAIGRFDNNAWECGNQQRMYPLEPLTKLDGRPLQSHYNDRAAELRAQGIPCSSRTLRRYYQLWDWAGQDRPVLVFRMRRTSASGKPCRHRLLARYPQVTALVDEAIRSLYLTKTRRPSPPSPGGRWEIFSGLEVSQS